MSNLATGEFAGRTRSVDASQKKIKAIGGAALTALGTIVTPDTLLRWYRNLVATKYDGHSVALAGVKEYRNYHRTLPQGGHTSDEGIRGSNPIIKPFNALVVLGSGVVAHFKKSPEDPKQPQVLVVKVLPARQSPATQQTSLRLEQTRGHRRTYSHPT